MKQTRLSSIVSLAVATAATTWSLCASAADPMQPILARNAREQARVHDALANQRIDPLRAAQVQQRAAEVYKQQAQVIPANPGPEQQEQLRQAQRDLAGAIAWAEKHPARNKGTAMDRTRLEVASARDAEQQHLIARQYAAGALTAEQVGTLQEAQARIAAAQYDVAVAGGTSQDEARLIQGAQNVQDYSIRRDPGVANLVSLQPEGQESATKND
jgi:hypothetical protein